MENKDAMDLFKSQFKFNLNQEARHKGDNKHGFSNDLGILIIGRILEEHSDDDGVVGYSRIYCCRLIRFSGSGDIANFKESELLTIEEYNRKIVDEEKERTQMRDEMYETEKEVYKSFGVERKDEVFLIKDGVVDKTNIYKVSGWEGSKDQILLNLRLVAGEGKKLDFVKVKSKSEFEHIAL